MSNMPSTGWPDSTLSLLSQGYEFISNRCQQYGSHRFQTRLLLRKVVCMRGEEAARIFYDNEKFVRKGAMPEPVRKTLLGEGGVQGLDGEAHRCRKQMFMAMMTPQRLEEMSELTAKHWQNEQQKWQQQKSVVLFDAVNIVLCRAACEWAGVPLSEDQVKPFTEELVAMIESPAALSLRHLEGRKARKKAERRLAAFIEEIRGQEPLTLESRAAQIIATHRDLDQQLLDSRIAAVELLNILRPIVAIGRFIVFGALALHQHPEARRNLETCDKAGFKCFIQEIRRFYPFFPTVAGVVKQEFTWQEYTFPKGQWVLLDLYGTNHDPEIWEKPQTFDPKRFVGREDNSFDLIPQGGGDYHQHHRCAGEWLTIEVMEVALRKLTREMEYKVPSQDLSFSLSHMPAIPKSRFIVSDVRAR